MDWPDRRMRIIKVYSGPKWREEIFDANAMLSESETICVFARTWTLPFDDLSMNGFVLVVIGFKEVEGTTFKGRNCNQDSPTCRKFSMMTRDLSSSASAWKSTTCA